MVDAVSFFNSNNWQQTAFGQYSGGNSSANSWEKAAVAQGIKPQTTQPVTPLHQTGGVEGTKGVLAGSSEAAISSIGANGMRAYDTTVGVNEPMATGTFHNGQQTGVVGGKFRMNM